MSRFLINGSLGPATMPPLDDSALEAFLLRIGADRSRALEQSVRNEAAENRAGNALVNQINEVLQELNIAAPDPDEGDTSLAERLSDRTVAFLRSIRPNGNNQNLFDAFIREDNGVQETINDGDFQRLTEAVRTEIDQATSDSQLNLIRLQGLINRSNQATEYVTNVVQRFSGLQDRVTPNLRQ